MSMKVGSLGRKPGRAAALAAIAAALPAAAAADAAGVWRSEADDQGSYLEITVGPCESDGGKTCGVISKAVTSAGEDPGYQHLGKVIVADMSADGDNAWSGGTIWDPTSGKTYKSTMKLVSENELDVDGCVAIFCEGQAWQRVK